jgi:hypothetical protein
VTTTVALALPLVETTRIRSRIFIDLIVDAVSSWQHVHVQKGRPSFQNEDEVSAMILAGTVDVKSWEIPVVLPFDRRL